LSIDLGKIAVKKQLSKSSGGFFKQWFVKIIEKDGDELGRFYGQTPICPLADLEDGIKKTIAHRFHKMGHVLSCIDQHNVLFRMGINFFLKKH
jgi:hypothetical protein